MFDSMMPLETLIRAAGWGQLALVAASGAIPHVLHWRAELVHVSTLTRRLFWVYAAYILSFNLGFGLVSAFAPQWLLDRTPLGAAVCAAIAFYWGARLVIQFACFGGIEKPAGGRYRAAEAALVTLFVFLTVTYAAAFLSRWWSFPG